MYPRRPALSLQSAVLLLGGAYQPVGCWVGFIEASPDRVLEDLTQWRKGLGQELTVTASGPFPRCLDSLEPLESPWTTELLVSCGTWTAYLNNDKNGGDPTSAASLLARHLNVRCVIAGHSPRYGPGHGGTQIWITGPDGVPPLMYVRTLAATSTDGRWEWLASGAVQDFEDVERYRARLIRHRLDRDLLVRYLLAQGIAVDEPTAFGNGITVQQHVPWPTNPETREQARVRVVEP
jgi:hypothetical protein